MKATKDFFEEFRKELRRRTLEEDLEDASLAEEINENTGNKPTWEELFRDNKRYRKENGRLKKTIEELRKQVGEIDAMSCLLYTSPSPRDPKTSRMPSSA